MTSPPDATNPETAGTLDVSFSALSASQPPENTAGAFNPVAVAHTSRRYEVGKVIARGGMGAILNAREATLKRVVAMKVMLNADSDESLARFVIEAQVTGQLEHPNIVPVHELGVDEKSQTYYTMKMVQGVTLRNVLENLARGDAQTIEKYPLTNLLTIFQKVCDAMAFAHSKGIIHRDLKPENIMLGDFGEVLVMDWGLAKILSERNQEVAGAQTSTAKIELRENESGTQATMEGAILGTLRYMAPEQAKGWIDQLDARSDIYALGGILYHILALRTAVDGPNANSILIKVCTGKIESPIEAVDARTKLPHLPDGRVPESLSAVALKAMALDQEHRYQRVTELQRDIAAYQNGFATSAENAGLGKQARLLVKRHKGIFATAFAAWFMITALALWFVISVTHAKKLAEDERNRATASEKEQARLRGEAENSLAKLRETAPTFYEQAQALIASGEASAFDKALDKIDFAIELDHANANYHVLKANTLQALARLSEAADVYRRVLALQQDNAVAKLNLDICEKLIAASGGIESLSLPLKTKLLDEILAQKRQADAVPLSHELKRDADTAMTTIKTRLKAVIAQPNWSADRLTVKPDGTYYLNLKGLKVPDLGILKNLPISDLDLSGFSGVDLAPLGQLPLRSLALCEIKNGNLEPLRGLKLEQLDLTRSGFNNLSPLMGMPLKRLTIVNVWSEINLTPLSELPLNYLEASSAGVRDLRPLRGVPLAYLSIQDTKVESLDGLENTPLRTLNMSNTQVEDLAPLRGNKTLRDLFLHSCRRIHDLTPLGDIPALERLIVPTHISDIAFLKKHPTLKNLGNLSIQSLGWDPSRITAAADFWKKNGDRLALQVPMEKQLEKFRQSLIAQGNAPGKLARFSFEADGQLKISLTSDDPETFKALDISALIGLPVTTFYCNATSLIDISALRGAPLKIVKILASRISDLSPLIGAPIEHLDLRHNRALRDLLPLRGMPLRAIFLGNTDITDVSMLAEFKSLEEIVLPKGARGVEKLRTLPALKRISDWYIGDFDTMASKSAAEFWKEYDAKVEAVGNLENLRRRLITAGVTGLKPEAISISPSGKICADLTDASISDLALFRGYPVDEVHLCRSAVKSLELLSDLPLVTLHFNNTDITDVSPLLKIPTLQYVILGKNATNIETLREAKNIKKISYDWIKQNDKCLPAQTAAEFWESYDGQKTKWPEVLSALRKIGLTDQSAQQATVIQAGLLELDLRKIKDSDISPLAGLAIGRLDLQGTSVSDISALRGMPLQTLCLGGCKITDLTPLKGMALTELNLGVKDSKNPQPEGTIVCDLQALRGMPLERLYLDGTIDPDLTPLTECKKLQRVVLPLKARNVEALRKLPALRQISWGFPGSFDKMPDAETFWREYDAKKIGGRK